MIVVKQPNAAAVKIQVASTFQLPRASLDGSDSAIIIAW